MKLTEKKKDKAKVSFAIEGDISIYSVKELKDELSKHFENNKNMEIDLSAVDKLDTAGFQLLLMARKELESKDKKLSIINPSSETERIFKLYGEDL